MITQLTSDERRYAAGILFVIATAGALMAASGPADHFGVHGVIILILAGGLLFFVLTSIYEPESGQYDDMDGAAERVLLADMAESPLRSQERIQQET